MKLALFKSLMRLSGQTYETYAASMSTKYCPLRRRLHCAIVRILAIRQYFHLPLLDVDKENILLFYINRAQSPLYSRGKSKKKGERDSESISPSFSPTLALTAHWERCGSHHGYPHHRPSKGTLTRPVRCSEPN